MPGPLLPVYSKVAAEPTNKAGRACRIIFYQVVLVMGIALCLLLIHFADKLNTHRRD